MQSPGADLMRRAAVGEGSEFVRCAYLPLEGNGDERGRRKVVPRARLNAAARHRHPGDGI